MTIVIAGLQHDATMLCGPSAAERLQHVFSEKFDPYLRERNSKITITCGGKPYHVEPLTINLPSVGEAFREAHLSSDWQKVFGCQFWFDASGRSKVAIAFSFKSKLRNWRYFAVKLFGTGCYQLGLYEENRVLAVDTKVLFYT